MEYEISCGTQRLNCRGAFDLKNTFDCGQCFRWNENPDGSWTGIVNGQKATIRTDGGSIIIDSDSPDIWSRYLDLGTDYDSVRNELKALCPGLGCAVDSINGIRILCQEPWEALCSFIISQNNNIPRIKGIVERLCDSFGEDKGGFRSFPGAEKLAALSPEDLAPLRAGFRARYIIDAARKVAGGQVDLPSMYERPIAECRTELMTITGVGAKVAECTLLYGLHRLEAFPIDVWMKKALSTLFSGITPEDIGPYAGIAQQYIFHYSRLNPEMVK